MGCACLGVGTQGPAEDPPAQSPCPVPLSLLSLNPQSLTQEQKTEGPFPSPAPGKFLALGGLSESERIEDAALLGSSSGSTEPERGPRPPDARVWAGLPCPAVLLIPWGGFRVMKGEGEMFQLFLPPAAPAP